MTSVTKKAIMAVTGILLFGFVIAHMLGNLQIFLGAEALNAYAHKLQTMPALLWPARIFLLAIFIIHVWISIQLARENRAARPVAYIQKNTVQASYASRTMVMSGLIVVAFIIYHLLHFTFGVIQPENFHLAAANGGYDVYSMMILGYQNIYVACSYIAAMALLCFHLSHGLSSLFQSLGFNHPKHTPRIQVVGKAIALLIFLGNSAIPAAVMMGVLKSPGGVS